MRFCLAQIFIHINYYHTIFLKGNLKELQHCGKYIDVLRAKDASKYPGETDSQIIRYDLTSNKSTIIAKSISSYAGFKSTDKYVYYYSPKTEKYYRYTYSNGKVKKITKEKYDSIPEIISYGY